MRIKLVIFSVFLATFGISIGEIVVNDYLSFKGFIDLSYSYIDESIDPSGASNYDETDRSSEVEEVEVSLLFEFAPVSAQIDIEYEDRRGSNLQVEQAFVAYRHEGQMQSSTITAGRYASMLGFEAYKPTGLYQYSNAYGGILTELFGTALITNGSFTPPTIDSDASVFIESLIFSLGDRYSQGLRYSFENDRSFFGFSIQDGTISYKNRTGGDDDADNTAVDDDGYGFEVAYVYDFGFGVKYFLGGSYETGDGINTRTATMGDTETYIINTYVTCELGAWLFAVELNYSESEIEDAFAIVSDTEIESITGLLMTNYAYSERSSVTGRISYTDLDGDTNASGGAAIDGKQFKYTIAHNYAFSDNLFLVAELSYVDGEFDSSLGEEGDLDEFLAAAELIFTF